MKFLVDAQLPVRLKKFIASKGFEVVHTDDLPLKDKTPDSLIRKLALEKEFIIVTKDNDFLDSHLLHQQPAKMLMITTGNIVNKELIELFEIYWNDIVDHFQKHDLLELTNSNLIAHEK